VDAFSKVGLPGEAAAYGTLLAVDGYEEMRDLAYAELLNKAALVKMGIKGGHAGRLLSVYGDLNPKNAAAKQTVYVQFKEGLCSVHPVVGFLPVSDLPSDTTFDALFDHIAQREDKLKQLKIGQVSMTVRSFLNQGSETHPINHQMSSKISELSDRKFVIFAVPKVKVPAQPKVDAFARMMNRTSEGCDVLSLPSKVVHKDALNFTEKLSNGLIECFEQAGLHVAFRHRGKVDALTRALVDALNYIAERWHAFPDFPEVWSPISLAGTTKRNGTRTQLQRAKLETYAHALQQYLQQCTQISDGWAEMTLSLGKVLNSMYGKIADLTHRSVLTEVHTNRRDESTSKTEYALIKQNLGRGQ
jgi:hypothetical protein